MPLIWAISRDWHRSLASLLRGAKRDLLVCSPFVGGEGTRFVTDNVAPAFQGDGHLTVLTNLSISNVCQLATDPRALRFLVDSIPQSTVFHLPGLHAKAYIADDGHAIITSGNLTAGGLYRNFEYGVEVKVQRVVRQMRDDLLEYSQLGAAVPRERLAAYSDALKGLYELMDREQRAAQRLVRQRFQESLRPIEDDLLRLRLSGGPIHTVFARTLEYLLRKHGPLTTVQIHPMIASIHPDLCDDSVDRVIDGKRFGKKWKHAARTAQQRLKKQGRIRLEHGIWNLA